jgi:hypothetical protein
MQEAGYVLGNLDCTIIAQKPKLSPHKVRHAGQPSRPSTLCGAACQGQACCGTCQIAAAAAQPLQLMTRGAVSLGSWRPVQSVLLVRSSAGVCCLQENIRANLCKLLEAHPSVINIKVMLGATLQHRSWQSILLICWHVKCVFRAYKFWL